MKMPADFRFESMMAELYRADAWSLHFDYVGAKIAEEHGAIWSGERFG